MFNIPVVGQWSRCLVNNKYSQINIYLLQVSIKSDHLAFFESKEQTNNNNFKNKPRTTKIRIIIIFILIRTILQYSRYNDIFMVSSTLKSQTILKYKS